MNALTNVISAHVKNMTATPVDVEVVRREGGITLASLRAFVAVVEEKSFSLAAQRLEVTQPGISLQLAALERACGFLVCHRKPQVALTEQGRPLFLKARLIISQMGEFEANVRDMQDTAGGRIRVGMSAPYVAMPLVARYRAQFPHVLLHTQMGNTSSLLEDVQQLRIDVGVMSLLEPLSSLACTLISAPRLMLCVRADDPMAKLQQVRVNDLAGRDIILREKGSLTRLVLEAAFAAEGLPLRSNFELASREAIKEAVAAGLGATALFDGELGGDGRLMMVPFTALPRPAGVYAVALRESLDLPHVGAFMACAALVVAS